MVDSVHLQILAASLQNQKPMCLNKLPYEAVKDKVSLYNYAISHIN